LKTIWRGGIGPDFGAAIVKAEARTERMHATGSQKRQGTKHDGQQYPEPCVVGQDGAILPRADGTGQKMLFIIRRSKGKFSTSNETSSGRFIPDNFVALYDRGNADSRGATLCFLLDAHDLADSANKYV